MDKELEKVKVISTVLKESCTNEQLRTYLIGFANKSKLELLEEFKKANPYYHMKIEECLDFQRIIKKLKH